MEWARLTSTSFGTAAVALVEALEEADFALDFDLDFDLVAVVADEVGVVKDGAGEFWK